MNKYFIFIFFLALLYFSSCTQQKKMIYFQGDLSIDTVNYPNQQYSLYKLQPGDFLYIKVLSINDNITKLFNLQDESAYRTTSVNEASMYIHGYVLNDLGEVTLPIVGNIKVSNESIESAQTIIQERIKEYIKDALVIVKLTSYRVTVVGEVTRPGVFFNYSKNISIVDALGKAGDITPYGNRENVMVIRQTPDGMRSYRINLLDNKVIATEAYYIHPNDVIYVEPVKSKAWRMNAPNVSIILSSITTLIVLYNFISRL